MQYDDNYASLSVKELFEFVLDRSYQNFQLIFNKTVMVTMTVYKEFFVYKVLSRIATPT